MTLRLRKLAIEMRRTKSTLADGRDIFYFDLEDSPNRLQSDKRELSSEPVSQGSMRYDLLTGEWVAIAGHRQQRVLHPGKDVCPLCPSSEENQSEIPEASYDVVVFENRFPSFSGGFTQAVELKDPDWGAEVPSAGRCEVIAYTSDHAGSIGSLTTSEMQLVINAWMDRAAEIAKIKEVEYIFIFENRGAEVGVTLHHPHGQIYGYPYIPTYVTKLLSQAKKYRAKHNRSMLDDVVARELLSDERIVYQDSNWVAFVPHAARWPFEVQVHPLRNFGFLTELNEREFQSLAYFLPVLISALDQLFMAPLPYMAGWIQAPLRDKTLIADARLFLRLVSVQRGEGKLKYLAGSESLMGAWISDVLPEDAASRIRAAIKTVQSQ